MFTRFLSFLRISKRKTNINEVTWQPKRSKGHSTNYKITSDNLAIRDNLKMVKLWVRLQFNGIIEFLFDKRDNANNELESVKTADITRSSGLSISNPFSNKIRVFYHKIKRWKKKTYVKKVNSLTYIKYFYFTCNYRTDLKFFLGKKIKSSAKLISWFFFPVN